MNNWNLGIIALDGGAIIAQPLLSSESLRGSGVALRSEHPASSPNTTRVNIGPVTIDGFECFVDEYFNGSLSFIILYLSETAAKGLMEVVNGNQELEFYASWIRKHCGRHPPIEFDWGSISAAFDHWTLEPSIIFRYR